MNGYPTFMKWLSKWLALIISIGLCFAAAGIGSLMTTPALRQWYPALHKPAWTPPDRVFAPVWTALYLSMAIAAWMVWLRRPWPEMTPAVGLFAVQLGLNVAWSALFFGLHSLAAGLVAIVLLWCAILAMGVAFHRVSALAGWILAPYLVWVSFAAALNFAIWRLN